MAFGQSGQDLVLVIDEGDALMRSSLVWRCLAFRQDQQGKHLMCFAKEGDDLLPWSRPGNTLDI